MARKFTFLVIVWGFVGMAQARSGDTVRSPTQIDKLLVCTEITADPERLSCFDQRAAMAKAAIIAEEVVIVNKAEVRETRRSLFGFSLPRIRLFGEDDAPGPSKMEAVTSLETSIASAKPGGGYGLWMLALSEGGTWQTTEADRDFEPRNGQKIVIKRGPLGNYNAKVAGGAARRVRRIG